MRKSPLHGNRAGSSGLSWPTRRHTCRPYLLRTILHGIHTHTHTPLAGYLQVRNAASSQWRVAVHELGSKAHLLPSTDYTFNDPIPFEVRRFLRDEGLRHPSFA